MDRTFLVGIAGGSASGKTTLAREIAARFGPERVQLLVLDAYYKDRDLPDEERARLNYDHPDAFDLSLLLDHARAIRAGRGIDRPVYDYARHARARDSVRIGPAPVVLVEGILVLALAPLRELLDLKVFVDVDADVRVLRRLRRDVAERGRTIDSVISQYLDTVRPMHLSYVEPSREHADLVVPEGGWNTRAVSVLAERVESYLRDAGR